MDYYTQKAIILKNYDEVDSLVEKLKQTKKNIEKSRSPLLLFLFSLKSFDCLDSVCAFVNI